MLISSCKENGEIGKWKSKMDLSTGRWMHSAIVFKEKIYVFGGAKSMTDPVLTSVEVYDPISNKW